MLATCGFDIFLMHYTYGGGLGIFSWRVDPQWGQTQALLKTEDLPGHAHTAYAGWRVVLVVTLYCTTKAAPFVKSRSSVMQIDANDQSNHPMFKWHNYHSCWGQCFGLIEATSVYIF